MLCCYVLVLLASFVYKPKWKIPKTEATIGWDVSGYYWYLPGLFIYDDLQEQQWRDTIHDLYNPDAHQDQSYQYDEGIYVNKYSCGMALQYLPAFAAAHLYATNSHFPADGFSTPYQLAIQIWSVLYCLLGLFLMRRVLLLHFTDKVAALTLLLVVFGTNYLNSAAIDSAMSHNYLCTLYAALILLSRRYYRGPTIWLAAGIGLVLGIMALSRPTEILAAIIPLTYGIQLTNKESLKDRLSFINSHYHQYITAVLLVVAVGSIQLLYWHHATGSWLVYSYRDQGFSWLAPHFILYNFSYASGWLTYTPLMLFAVAGLIAFTVRHRQHEGLLLFFGLFWYVTCAWDYWNYGGRAMVQSYAVLVVGLAYMLQFVAKDRGRRSVCTVVCMALVYYNLWWTHGIHKGKYTNAYTNTKSYFWRTLGRWDFPVRTLELLDTEYLFEGEEENLRQLAVNDFDYLSDSLYKSWYFGEDGYDFVNQDRKYSDIIEYELPTIDTDWYRVQAQIFRKQKEYIIWKQPVLAWAGYTDNEQKLYFAIRLDRTVDGGQNMLRWIDVPAHVLKKHRINKIRGFLIHSGSIKPTLIDDLAILAFDEK